MKEMVETGSKEVAAPIADFGFADDLTADDLQIGRIAVAQAMSESTKNEVTKIGDIYNTATLEVLGSKDKKPVEFIPVYLKKYWVHKDGDNYLGTTEFIHKDQFPFEEGPKKNYVTYSFFVLLTAEMKDGVAMPYQLVLQSSGLSAARKINAFAAKLKRMKKAPWARTYLLTAVHSTKEKYSWWKPDVTVGRDTSASEIADSVDWAQQLKGQEHLIKQSIQDTAKETQPEYVSEETDF